MVILNDQHIAMPILCNYYVTYRCNATCDFCHFGDHAQFRSSRHARTADVLANLPQLRAEGVRFIDFTGGEPLLHPELDVLCGAAQRVGMRTSVTTNGLLYPKYAARLAGRVDLLHFSLDSADPAQHDAMRGVPCFDAVMESITVARSLGEHPDLLCTVTDANADQLEAVYDIARRNRLMLLLNPVFSYFREESLSEATMRAILRVARRPMTYLNPAFLELRRRGGNDPENPLCRAVSRVIVISPENELLLPCYHLHFEKIPIDGDLAAACASPRRAWHEQHEGRHDVCRGCTINCYFEPSFAFPTSMLALSSVPSKLRYGIGKYIRQRRWMSF